MKGTKITFDFIHADQVDHLRRGRQWLSPCRRRFKVLLQQETKAIPNAIARGVVGEQLRHESDCGRD